MDQKTKEKLLSIESKLEEHAFPPQLVIENTSACNQQCIHCSHKELQRPKKHMKRELWDKLVEEIGRVAPNTEIWPTFYGEALILGPELWDRINYADSVGCKNIVLNSNATLLHHRNAIDYILKSPLKRFILSLDGFTKETYEKVRVLGKWEVVYSGVAELLKEKERRGQRYPEITCQFSLMEENEHEVEDFRAYWSALGAQVKVRPKLEWAAVGSIRSDRLDHEPDFRIACPWGNNTMAIHRDGNVVACAVDYEGTHSVGNVNDMTIQEAWQRLGSSLRCPHRKHDWENIPGICKGCNDWQTAGAEYEKPALQDTRPFWYKEGETDFKIPAIKIKDVTEHVSVEPAGN